MQVIWYRTQEFSNRVDYKLVNKVPELKYDLKMFCGSKHKFKTNYLSFIWLLKTNSAIN